MKQADGWLLSAFALTGVWENLLKFRRVIFVFLYIWLTP